MMARPLLPYGGCITVRQDGDLGCFRMLGVLWVQYYGLFRVVGLGAGLAAGVPKGGDAKSFRCLIIVVDQFVVFVNDEASELKAAPCQQGFHFADEGDWASLFTSALMCSRIFRAVFLPHIWVPYARMSRWFWRASSSQVTLAMAFLPAVLFLLPRC